MGDVKNLQNKEAIEKMKELAESIDICMFCTNPGSIPFDTRPMSTQEVDEQGNFWFLSTRQSNKDQEIKQDDKVQLIYADRNNSHYLSVSGSASIYYDRDKIEKIWAPEAKAWFTEGKDDPDISVICVKAHEAYYWDTKHGQLVAFAKQIAGAVLGKTLDDSIEGTLQP